MGASDFDLLLDAAHRRRHDDRHFGGKNKNVPIEKKNGRTDALTHRQTHTHTRAENDRYCNWNRLPGGGGGGGGLAKGVVKGMAKGVAKGVG